MLTLNFRTQQGQIYSRHFEKNVGLSMYGKATTVTGLINPGTGIQIDVTDENGRSYFSDTTLTDIWGDFDFWMMTPNYDTELEIKIFASYPVSGQDTLIVPIAIGNREPDPMPTPEKEFSWLELLPFLAIGLAALLIYQQVKE